MPLQKTLQPLAVHMPSYGIHILESHHSQGFKMDWLNHSFSKIIFIISGSGTLLTRKKNYRLNKECLVYIPPHMPHKIEDARRDPLCLYALCIDWKIFTSRNSMRQLQAFALIANIPVKALFERPLRQILFEQTSCFEGHELMISSLTQRVMCNIVRYRQSAPNPSTREHSSSRQRVVQVWEDLKRNFYAEQQLDEAAKQAGLSKRHFIQIFKEVTGDTWLNQVRRLRLNYAAHLLKETDRTITAICFECGFHDLSNFYRAFKTHFGQPPVVFRTESREKCKRSEILTNK
ncbi:helix-turn-helix domain-containing protein [Rubellicoccus peritrichatus]|uniref:helix-turn-helix domain-containing protein n=1 Tax=Rubellicoccus peritrichatus TaxID=3080537 RepID=UPI003CE5304A